MEKFLVTSRGICFIKEPRKKDWNKTVVIWNKQRALVLSSGSS